MEQLKGIELTDLCRHVGTVTIIWAHIERQLDNWRLFIFNVFKDDSICKKVPFSLNQKISFLRWGFHKFEELSDLESRAFDLLDRVNVIADKRHAFVHGVVESTSPDTLTFERVRLEEGIQVIIKDEFDIDSYETFLRELLDLMGSSCIFSNDLLKKKH